MAEYANHKLFLWGARGPHLVVYIVLCIAACYSCHDNYKRKKSITPMFYCDCSWTSIRLLGVFKMCRARMLYTVLQRGCLMGNSVFVVFWHHWCSPCEGAMGKSVILKTIITIIKTISWLEQFNLNILITGKLLVYVRSGTVPIQHVWCLG